MRGRRRAPSNDELRDGSTVFRPNAVLALVGDVRETSTQEEKALAAHLDGFRPLARVRTKTGMSAMTLRRAVELLLSRDAVRLVAIIEAERDDGPELLGLRDLGSSTTDLSGKSEELSNEVGANGAFDNGETMPRNERDLIPPHVMAEIEAMVDEEVRRKNDEQQFDEETSLNAGQDGTQEHDKE